MKYYHMIIEKDGKRREYISATQGSAPAGWKCICICGYHEKPDDRRNPEK